MRSRAAGRGAGWTSEAGALGCAFLLAAARALSQADPPQNLLILVADDLGVDKLARYGEHPGALPTPHLDDLARAGVLFRNAWSSPLCSPARAGLLTGRYGFRTGIGGNVRPWTAFGPGLAGGELTLPKLLGPRYQSAAFGKWHLAPGVDGIAEADHPRASGFGHFAGTLGNLTGDETYTSWWKTADGFTLPEPVAGYATSVVVDDALAWIAQAGEPWLVWAAFHAVHTPLHAPPPHLHSVLLPGPPELFRSEHHAAMLDALDREIGRLLAGLPPGVRARTTIVFAGDNGTARAVTTPPSWSSHAKGTVYQGGIHVPLIVASPFTSPARRGEESQALVSLVDVFATVAEIAGAPPGSTDSVSLLPYLVDPSRASLRATAYAESFSPNGPGPYRQRAQAVRDARYKLIRSNCTRDELYDLETDPSEKRDLLRRRPLAPEPEAAERELAIALEAVAPYDCDADGDGWRDVADNCLDLPNRDQRDTDRDGFGNACDADYTNSGVIEGADFQLLIRAFGRSAGEPGYRAEIDSDGDGHIGSRELNFLLRHFGSAPGPSGLACAGRVPCPEP